MALLKISRKGERPKEHNVQDDFPHLTKDELGISDAAAERVFELLEQKGPGFYLRVAIRGGGCSGLSLHFELTDQVRKNDVYFKKNKASVVIDEKSLSILGGATLHCRDYLGSKEFKLVNNPVEKQCSCGQSFSL